MQLQSSHNYNQFTARQLLAWEKNFLLRRGLSLAEIATIEAGAQGEKPVEYICGTAEFLDFELKVVDKKTGEKTLIPRIESEFLAKKGAEIISQKFAGKYIDAQKTKEILRIAEIGTGSGAISLGLLTLLSKNHKKYENKAKNAQKVHLPDQNKTENYFGLQLWASDIEPRVLKIAMENFDDLASQNRFSEWQSVHLPSSSQFSKLPSSNTIFWLQSDLWQNFPSQLQFNLILANLPYVPSKNRNKLPASVIDFEPNLALFGGDNGLDIISRFLMTSASHLTPDGEIWLEVDETHHPQQLSATLQKLWQIEIYLDFADKPRFWRLTRR